MFLSIGGNDAGFARYVLHMVAPDRARFAGFSPIFKGIRQAVGKPLTEDDAKNRIRTNLPAGYGQLAREIDALKQGAPGSILITTYPTPLFREDGTACGKAVGDGCNEERCRISMFELFNEKVPSFLRLFGRWQFQISGGVEQGETEMALAKVLGPLNNAVKKAADDHGWRVASGFQDAVLEHGFCAVSDSSNSAHELGWTMFTNGSWTGVDPAKWNPYAPRARWFRTVHDSVLTQYTNSGSGKWTGMAHPDAREHAAVARSIVETLADR